MEVQTRQRQPPVTADLGDAVAHGVQGILGEVGDDGAWCVYEEALQAGSARSDGDGQIQAQPGFAGLRRSADHTDGGPTTSVGSSAPDLLDQPRGAGGLLLEGVDWKRGQDRQGAGTLRASTTSPADTALAPVFTACSSDLRARRSMARRLPTEISKIDS